ncbi:3-hydroxyacyl-CoA dehydrogenase NAD-binding domain-containing protein [Nitratireductor pacificus]|uniref:enoyl-CoA hydratase n=1 Tax=Nitratireductor pacificus pht-3B TaxID=391937 RepID=K2N9U8_9HYPH|nr:3-hydroxyacyl-CoA dehydrogenase NAD-binding domain-containing protein [Nitratireductor pacificus]EKF20913.1 3-hydroxyacyl-CoA dehydrogenase [Nitratireductor pacificus pht-3B]
MSKTGISAAALLAPRAMDLGPAERIDTGAVHWRLARDAQDVAWLVLDRAGESANTLSEAVMAELDMLLGRIEAMKPKGLVIRSAKKSGFIAGADIRDFQGIADSAEVEARMTQAHAVIDRLAALPMPTLAVVHGHCLGGGLELALACRYRIAIDGASFGFPEVLLGLHPGLGGTFRLPALIDPLEAMTMMLTGKTAHTKRAKALGLVDAVIEERHVQNAVAAAMSGKLRKPRGNWKSGLLGFSPARGLAARRMRAETEKRVSEAHYPAPYRLIDLWEEHGGDAKAMQKAEIRSFAALLAGVTAQNLIRVFFLREGLKAQGKGDSDIAHVHVIGAGTMGGDIAAWCAARGLKVTLTDIDAKAIARAVGRASSFFDKRLYTGIDRRDAFDRLGADFSGDGAGRADLVIEAVAENADIKRTVYKAVAPRMKEGALLATNTSSIPLEQLRRSVPFPERLFGLHFFNPVTRMELVEVVGHDKAAERALQRARAFCGAIDRLPVPVRSAPGFLVNRVLTPYLMEALVMLDEGIDKETIDKAAETFGMPMGPIELADRVGLDICLEVARTLKDGLKTPMPDVPAWLETMVSEGRTGRKAGKGLYDYDAAGNPKKKTDTPPPHASLSDRLILPLINACVACLREGIVADETTLDAAVIFGTGFAPFRGGPLHYARSRGIDDLIAELERLREKFGDRFAPDAGWNGLGKTG